MPNFYIFYILIEIFQIKACLNCQDVGRLESDEFLTIQYDNKQYRSDSIIPISFPLVDGYAQFELTFNCTNSCYPSESLKLATRTILQNIPQRPDEEPYGVFQDGLAVEYPILIQK